MVFGLGCAVGGFCGQFRGGGGDKGGIVGSGGDDNDMVVKLMVVMEAMSVATMVTMTW